MTYSQTYGDFLKDKNNFIFQAQKSALNTTSARHRAFNQKYDFLAVNRQLIEEEFNHLFQSLEKDKKKRKEFWLYCYYLSILLQNYYAAYGLPAKAEEYKGIRRKIWNHCKEKPLTEESKKSEFFLLELGRKLLQEIKDVIKSPAKISTMREKIGFYNAARLYWAFERLITRQALYLLRDLRFLDKVSRLTGKAVDIEKFLNAIDKPNDIFRVLSVGFFMGRLLLNTSVLLKHTFAPAKEEADLPMAKRFALELYKRHPVLLNDFVWMVINTLTNFRELFRISSSVAGWITVGFLVFDIAVLLWRKELAEREYLTKFSQYHNELDSIEMRLGKKGLAEDKRQHLLQHQQLLRAQLNELEIERKARQANLNFNTAAASLIFTGFTASMVMSNPALLLVAFFLCMSGVAMYLSDSSYQTFREKKERLVQTQVAEKEDKKALKAYTQARNDFILTMVKNTVMPTLIIVTFAISWQAALLLTAVYLSYELWHAWQKHKNNSESEEKDSEVDEKNKCLSF